MFLLPVRKESPSTLCTVLKAELEELERWEGTNPGLPFADMFTVAPSQECLLAEAGPGAEAYTPEGTPPSSPLQAAGLLCQVGWCWAPLAALEDQHPGFSQGFWSRRLGAPWGSCLTSPVRALLSVAG